MQSSIRCHHLTKSYQEHIALRDVSLHLPAGSITGLLGSNGAGKSTLIKCILGLIQPDSGNSELTAGASLGYLPELVHLPPAASAWSVVQLGLRLSKCANSNQTTSQTTSLLSRLCLDERHWRKPLRQLSKGMRQRVALAYAIAGDPQWLILDEPMSGLDAMGRKQFLDILLDLNRQGVGMLVCSHIVPDLVRLCERVLLIHQGEIVDQIDIPEHSMDEAEALESRLIQIAGYRHE